MISSDYFLISRNNTVYKCPVYALSTVLCFISEKEKFISEIYDLSATMIDIESFFPLTHYTRSEIKSEFTTKKELETLKENATYIKKTEAAAEVAKLSSESQVKQKFEDEGKYCLWDILSNERDKIEKIMTWTPGKNHTPVEYLDKSANEDVVKSFITNNKNTL